MPVSEEALMATGEDVYNWIIDTLRNRIGSRHRDQRATYGFDLFVPNLVSDFLRTHGARQGEDSASSREGSQLFPLFLDATWEMSLRGVLRPSWAGFNDQHFTGPGYGYSLTKQGREWIMDSNAGTLLYSTGKLGELFEKHKTLYGDAYHERSQESLRCFAARAFFGSCAMTGAAAEAILLKLAVAKLGDEKEALRIYHGRSGRRDLKEKVLALGQKPEPIRNEVSVGFTILSYWRDDAAHGSSLNIDATQASVALQMLCLFGISCSKHWTLLTS